MASYGKIVKSGALWALLARGTNEIVAIPTSMVLARLLTPGDFGVAAAVGFFVQIANRMTNFGFNTALIQLKTVEHQHTSSVFVVNLVTGIVMWLGLTLAAPWLGAFFGSSDAAAALPVAGLTFVVGAFGAVPASLLVRDLRFKETAMVEGIGTVVGAASGLALALLGFGYWSLVYSQLLSAVVPSAARLALSGWRPSLAFSRKALGELLSFGLGLHAKRLLDSAAQNLDNLVVGRSLGIDALGIYDKAFTLMNRAVILLSTAGPAVSFRVLALIGDDGPRFRAAYAKLVMVSAFVSYVMIAGLCMVAPELFRLMFGSQWNSAVVPFQVLCVAGALKVLNGYASSGIQAVGRAWGEVGRQTAYLALIVGGVAYGSRFGLPGAAVGVLVATFFMTLAMHHLLCRVTAVRWADLWRAQLPALVCSLGLVATLLVLRRAAASGLDLANAIRFFVLAFFVSCAYLLLFIRLAPFKDLDKALREMTDDMAPQWAARLWGSSRQRKAES